MEMKNVFSSQVSQIGYDASAKQLAVKFKNGRTAVYSDVPSDVARNVTEAPSVGTALHTWIKGKYAFGYLPERQA